MFSLLSEAVDSFQMSTCRDEEGDAFESCSYVTKLTVPSVPNNSRVASISSNRMVKCYLMDPAAGNLVFDASYSGHTDIVQDITFSIDNPQLLFSASEDRKAACWDLRAASSQVELVASQPLFSVSCSGHMVAAGGSSNVFLWDIRQPRAPARVLEDFHTEDIVVIRFAPDNPNVLLSGSQDCLVNKYELNELDDDEVLAMTISVDEPVSKMNFFGPQSEYLAVISSIENLSLWTCSQGMRLSHFQNTRGLLSEAVRGSVDYLIATHYDTATQRLFLGAGSTSGDFLVAEVNVNRLSIHATATRPPLTTGGSSFMTPPTPSLASANMTTNVPRGHTDIIRDYVVMPGVGDLGGMLVTAGQDAKVCVWSDVGEEKLASLRQRRLESKNSAKQSRELRGFGELEVAQSKVTDFGSSRGVESDSGGLLDTRRGARGRASRVSRPY
jgi:hypothetical protein